MAVIDTYDVITCARSYKRPISSRKARAELVRCAGSHFDPDIVDAFVNISTGRVRFAAGPLAGLAQLPFVSAVAQTGVAVAAITPAAAIPAATALAVGAIVTAGPVAAATNRAQPATGVSVTSSGPAGASGRSSGSWTPAGGPPRHQPDHDHDLGDGLPAVTGLVAHDHVGHGILGRLPGQGGGRHRCRPARDRRRHRPGRASPPRGASSPRRQAPPP